MENNMISNNEIFNLIIGVSAMLTKLLKGVHEG